MIPHCLMLFLSVLAVVETPVCDVALEGQKQKAMQPAFYVVGSRVKDVKALGGFASSSNYPQQIPDHIRDNNITRPGSLSVVVTDRKSSGNNVGEGGPRQIFIVNRTSKRLTFPAQDSAIALHQEALDKSGVWRPIEYRPSSWCGNSYHNVFLGPNESWQLSAMVYTGPFKTKLRYALKLDTGKYVYSNEYDGNIHEFQFEKPEGN